MLILESHPNIRSICSAERSKYELRVRSYRNDKKQLDAELDKAVQRLKDNASRDELMAYDNQISLNQVGLVFYHILHSSPLYIISISPSRFITTESSISFTVLLFSSALFL